MFVTNDKKSFSSWKLKLNEHLEDLWCNVTLRYLDYETKFDAMKKGPLSSIWRTGY